MRILRIVSALVIALSASLSSAYVEAIYTGPTAPTSANADENLMRALQVPASCKADAEAISQSLYGYEIAVRNEEDRFKDRPQGNFNTSNSYRQIKSILKNAEDNAPECFAPLAMFYALHSSANNFSQAGLLPLLYLNGNLKPISLRDRASLGGQWNELTSKGELHHLLGGYDCASSTIYFDAYAAPFDIFAILQHETDHLLRDKLLTRTGTGLSIAEYILMDELVASLRAGFEEFGDRTLVPSVSDLTLFNENGNLVNILQAHDENLNVIWGQWEAFPYFIQHAFLDPSSNAQAQTLIKMVDDVYFAKPIATSNLLKKLRSLSPKQIVAEYPGWGRYHILGLRPAEADKLLKALRSPSRMCREFRDALHSGALDDYLGSKITDPSSQSIHPGTEGLRPGTEGLRPGTEGLRPGTEGLRPGTEGLRPGTEGLRPGTEGLRPGTEGLRPGTEGLRPGTEGLRPCVHPPEEF